VKPRSGFLLKNVPCDSCGGTHDLFVAALTSPHDEYAYTCPKTGQRATASYDQASRIVTTKPEDSLSAIRLER
jgi:hypothetical protein